MRIIGDYRKKVLICSYTELRVKMCNIYACLCYPRSGLIRIRFYWIQISLNSVSTLPS